MAEEGDTQERMLAGTGVAGVAASSGSFSSSTAAGVSPGKVRRRAASEGSVGRWLVVWGSFRVKVVVQAPREAKAGWKVVREGVETWTVTKAVALSFFLASEALVDGSSWIMTGCPL